MFSRSESPSRPSRPSRPARWRRRTQVLTAGAAAGGLVVVAAQVLPASAAPSDRHDNHAARAGAVAAAQPPADRSWIQGVLTDQAGHPLNNVNVEVWSADPGVGVPVASNLSYAGSPADGAHQKGVFRVEVPAGAAYRITLSTVGGREDGDRFRMARVGGGRPIMARAGRTTLRAVPGRTLDLGTIQLARQGKVASKVKVTKPHKATSGKRVRLTVRVTSRYVSNPTGKVRVRVAGKTVTSRIGTTAHGRTHVRLPKLKAGKQVVKVSYLGSSTVAKSKAKPVRVTVKRR